MILIRASDSLAQEVEREQETPIFIGIIIFNIIPSCLLLKIHYAFNASRPYKCLARIKQLPVQNIIF